MKHTDNDNNIFSIGNIEISNNPDSSKPNLKELPIIPTRNLVLFPGITFPVTLGRPSSVETAELADANNLWIGIVCQRNPETEYPIIPNDIYEYGVLAKIVKVFDLPDGNKTAIIRAYDKIKVVGAAIPDQFSTVHSVVARKVRDREPVGEPEESKYLATISAVKEAALSIISMASEGPNELEFNIKNCHRPDEVINLVATHAPLPSDVKIKLLSKTLLDQRALQLLAELKKSKEFLNLTRDIQERTHQVLSDQQRTMFLTQQMETIRHELYGDDDDATMFKKKGESIAFPEEVQKVFDRETDKLSRLNPQSPDYAIQYSYLDLLVNLPWGKHTELSTTLKEAEKILNSDHYGLEKVKERILEQLAVLMNTPDGKAPIICLVGAPGVGKTSLGQSIAKALGRNYQRISLGGMHDEAEIRGHRRTYIGAMPGRIIDAMRRADSANPVLLLDEIDKIGSDIKGDPTAALLEVLDPEQNMKFHDNYVDVDFDLSKVLFIATANTLSSLPQPLLDRMEVIDIPGYVTEEKIEIAKRHLIPRLMSEHAFAKNELKFSVPAIETIIDGYTSESGVRQLEKRIASIFRKIVVQKVSGNGFNHNIAPKQVRSLLGVPPYHRDRYEGNDYAGVVTGLAWTSAGGEILFVESSIAPGKEAKLTLTGNLGDVMKESAVIALQYVKSHAKELGISQELLSTNNLHLHVPEGAIPKDGPSAGITMVTSLVSALTGNKIRERIAMTGEITLRGKVLPVGGVREKILAAKRAGITTIILSENNKKDVEEIPSTYIKGINFIYVDTISQVLDFAILDEKATY